jgi:hypothetical protein
MKRRLLIGGVVGLVIGGVAACVALAAAGAGHGSYLPAALLFPFSMLIASAVGTVNPGIVVLALAQYPVYGAAVIGKAKSSKVAWLTVVGLHFVGAAVSLLVVQRSEVFG